MHATTCVRTGVNYIARRLIDKNLITKISEGNGGRGLATVFRLVVEDARYPEPRRKQTAEGDPAEQRKSKKPASNHCQVSAIENPPLEAPKPASSGLETCQYDSQNLPVATATLPKVLPRESILNPSKSETDGRMDSSSTTAAKDKQKEQAATIAERFFALTGQTLHCNGEFTTLARQHGFPTVLDAVERFARDGHDWSQIKNPAAFVRSRIEEYVAQAQAAIEAKRQQIAEQEEIEQIKAAAIAKKQAEVAEFMAEYERRQNDPNRYKI